MEKLQLSVNDIVRYYNLRPADATTQRPLVFISIDFEAYERQPHPVTEIGIAILDTRNVPGGEMAKCTLEEWFGRVKYAHWLISENKRFVNRRFVEGCPRNFEFGTTNMITLKNAPVLLDKIFSMPESMHNFASLKDPNIVTSSERVIIGHDLRNDTDYAHKLGFDPPSGLRQLDTQWIRGNWRLRPGLNRLLDALDLPYKYLHNAGNDAGFTMQAMLTMVAADVVAPYHALTMLTHGVPSTTFAEHLAALKADAPVDESSSSSETA